MKNLSSQQLEIKALPEHIILILDSYCDSYLIAVMDNILDGWSNCGANTRGYTKAVTYLRNATNLNQNEFLKLLPESDKNLSPGAKKSYHNLKILSPTLSIDVYNWQSCFGIKPFQKNRFPSISEKTIKSFGFGRRYCNNGTFSFRYWFT